MVFFFEKVYNGWEKETKEDKRIISCGKTKSNEVKTRLFAYPMSNCIY